MKTLHQQCCCYIPLLVFLQHCFSTDYFSFIKTADKCHKLLLKSYLYYFNSQSSMQDYFALYWYIWRCEEKVCKAVISNQMFIPHRKTKEIQTLNPHLCLLCRMYHKWPLLLKKIKIKSQWQEEREMIKYIINRAARYLVYTLLSTFIFCNSLIFQVVALSLPSLSCTWGNASIFKTFRQEDLQESALDFCQLAVQQHSSGVQSHLRLQFLTGHSQRLWYFLASWQFNSTVKQICKFYPNL